MNKLLIGAAAALVALPMAASAASLDGQAIFPGNQNQVWENPNDSVSIKTAIEANLGEVVHAIEFNFIDGGNLTTVCKDISNFEGAQKRTVTSSVNVPPNTGDYGLEINVFTAENMQEANARNGSAACQGDNDQVYSEGNVVHVVPNGSSNDNDDDTGSSGGASTTTLAALQSQLDALTKLFAGLQTIVAGMAPDAICAQKPADTHSLQLFFKGQNLMTQAEIDTGPGIFGPKTTRANNAFNLMHKCRA